MTAKKATLASTEAIQLKKAEAMFEGVAAKATHQDMLAFTDHRVSMLRWGAECAGSERTVKRKKPAKKVDPQAQARELSRSPSLVCLRKTIEETALLDTMGAITELERETNAFYGCVTTDAGKRLRDILVESGYYSTCMLNALVRYGRHNLNIPDKDRRNLPTLTYPIGAYLDCRENILKRIRTKGTTEDLIQRDERMLHRLTTTLGQVLEDENPEESVEMFVALWKLHVKQDGRNRPVARSPIALTIGLMELLLNTCNPKSLATMGAVDGDHIRKLSNINKLWRFSISGDQGRACAATVTPDP